MHSALILTAKIAIIIAPSKVFKRFLGKSYNLPLNIVNWPVKLMWLFGFRLCILVGAVIVDAVPGPNFLPFHASAHAPCCPQDSMGGTSRPVFLYKELAFCATFRIYANHCASPAIQMSHLPSHILHDSMLIQQATV